MDIISLPKAASERADQTGTLHSNRGAVSIFEMKIGYARVSTDEQHLDLQIDALRAAGCDLIFTDESCSGADVDRKGLNQALAKIGQGDVLVVWKLDRLARSLSYLILMIDQLLLSDAEFCSLQDGIDTTSPSGKLIFHILGALAEFELELIRERTHAGMNAAKRRGAVFGRPGKLNDRQIGEAHRRIARGETRVSIAKRFGVDVSTLRRYLNATKKRAAKTGGVINSNDEKDEKT